MIDFGNGSVHIYGETRCHNQIYIRALFSVQLYKIIDELSEILLLPFHKTPSWDEYEDYVDQEINKITEAQKNLWSKDILGITLDHTRSSVKYNCLVGPDKIDPDAWIYNSIGMHMTTEPRLLKDALKKFEQALEISPRYFDALYNAGACCANLSNYGKSVEYYKKALDLKPDDIDVQNELTWAESEL